MKRIITIIALVLALASGNVHAQTIVLETFSNVVAGSNTFYGSWEAVGATGGTLSPNAHFVQGDGYYDITGTTALIPLNDNSSKLEIFFDQLANTNIETNTFLAVSAQAFASNAASSFIVVLADYNLNTAQASFDTSAFPTGSFTTAYQLLDFQSGFDPTNIYSMTISGGITDAPVRFNISFDDISSVPSAPAIPEPATYVIFSGILALGYAAWRRRRAVRT